MPSTHRHAPLRNASRPIMKRSQLEGARRVQHKRATFAAPLSPWQRGTNGNTNGLLRKYFPKVTDLSRWTKQQVEAVELALNKTPRKTLGWKAPAEALNNHLKWEQWLDVVIVG